MWSVFVVDELGADARLAQVATVLYSHHETTAIGPLGRQLFWMGA